MALLTYDAAPSSGETLPIEFRGRKLRAAKTFILGTHRCRPPEETLERIRPHFATAGITRLADITGLDRIGVHTYMVYRPNGRTLSSASGKGFSRVAAQVSGAMEAIELYHAENPRLPMRRISYLELADEGPVIPMERLSYSRRSLFRPTAPEYWVDGWDLVSQCIVPVPFLSVAMVSPPRQEPLFSMPFMLDSNGLASGNHLLEAIVAGLLEVIERDATTCQMLAAHRHGSTMPRVDLDTIRHPLVLDVIERLQSCRVRPLIYDCSVDSDVPVYMAYIFDERDRHVGMGGGFGAHLDPEVAMVRALTEAVQSRAIYIAGARDDLFRHDKDHYQARDSRATIRELLDTPATVDARARPDDSTGSFEGDISVLLGKLRRIGLDQVIVTDLSHEDVDIPVVRVTVPGLEGYASRTYTAGPRARAFCDRAATRSA